MFLKLLLVGVALVGSFHIATQVLVKPDGAPLLSTAQLPTPTPSPMPFVELTIPYLRAKTYASTLGPLTKYSENGNYTTYLTNYTSDGLKINGLLTIPKTGERHPAIVFVHGYIAPSIYRTTERYTDYIDYLARNGFVVFKIDLRGNGSSEGEPGGAYYSGDYVVDTLNARAALASANFVNGKIGLWGHSMAGNVTTRALAAMPDIPAVVVWAGAGYSYEDLLKYGIDDNSYRPPTGQTNAQARRQKLRETHGEFKVDDPFWKQIPATNYLSDIKGAIEIHHAVDDTVVDVGYSRDFMTLLDKTSIPHKLYEYQSGGHNISGASFSSAMARTVAFFKTHLSE